MTTLRRWLSLAWRVRQRAGDENATLLAAAVAFYGMLSIVPGLVALLSLYGLFADPTKVRRQVLDALAGTPPDVRNFVSGQMTAIAARPAATAVTSAVVGVVGALWSASSGINHLLRAITALTGGAGPRPTGRAGVQAALRRRGTALLVTLGAMTFVLVALGAVAVLPALLSAAHFGAGGQLAVGVLSVVVLLVVLVGALSMLYRVGPHDPIVWRFGVSPGAIVGTLVWVAGSLAFSLYTSNVRTFNETYGALGVVIVLLLWLFISAYAIILGAGVNHELRTRT